MDDAPSAPLANFSTEIVPFELMVSDAKFSEGSNRNRDGFCQINANTDYQAIDIWLARTQDSPQTFRSYRKEIERLLLWSHRVRFKAFSDLRVDDMEAYKKFLSDPQPASDWCGPRVSRNHENWKPFEGPLKANSINQALIIIGTAFRFMVESGYMKGNPMKLVSRSRIRQQINKTGTVERYLEKDVWQYLWNYIINMPNNSEKESREYERTRFLFSLLYLQSPRVSEVANHLMRDFREHRNKWWWHITGKGNKVARIPVKQDMLKALIRYRQFLSLSPLPLPDELTPLVCSLKGYRAISADMVYKIVKRTVQQAADALAVESPTKAQWLRKASTHWFRHTSLTHQADSGVDLRYIQATARHASIETTQRYLHTEEDAWHSEMDRHSL